MKVTSTGMICVSCYFLRAQVNPINSSSSEIAHRRIKDQSGGSWQRLGPSGPQDVESVMRVFLCKTRRSVWKGPSAELIWRQKVSRRLL